MHYEFKYTADVDSLFFGAWAGAIVSGDVDANNDEAAISKVKQLAEECGEFPTDIKVYKTEKCDMEIIDCPF